MTSPLAQWHHRISWRFPSAPAAGRASRRCKALVDAHVDVLHAVEKTVGPTSTSAVRGDLCLVDHLPHIDVAGAETGFAVMQVELPELLEAIVEAERHDLFPGSPEAVAPFGERARIVVREHALAQMRKA